MNAICNMTVLSINSYRALLSIGQPALCGKLADCQGVFSRVWQAFQSGEACVMSVSYTHLTLPPSDLV